MKKVQLYYGFALFPIEMTIIKGDVEVQIRALMDAGFNGYRIAKQLNLKNGTVYDFMKKVQLYGSLPPKVKLYKGKIQGPDQLNIKRYLNDNPTATLMQIKSALNLQVALSTLCVYLKKFGLEKKHLQREKSS
jgi:transposase